MASAASQSSAGGSASNSISVDDGEAGVVNAKYPLWAHATKISSDETGRGGNTRFLCHFCDKDFPGSYSRVRAHLLQKKRAGVAACNKLPNHVFVQLCKDDEAAKELIENGPTRKTIPLPSSEGSGPSRKRKAGKQQGISESFNMETKQQADALIGRMFFTGGIPFNLARNPYFRASYHFVANNNMVGYVPPGYNALRTTLLEKEKKHMVRMLEPIRTTWPLKGITICTDGWSDPQRRPILNFMAVTEGGPMFLKSIATEGQKKSTEFNSSCCERNWSTYAFIHSSARNKLTPARAEDLVFTHNNHRLLSRHSSEYESGPSRMWDVGGDGVESFTGVGMLEGAELSLDEPELEAQMLDDLS